MNAAATPPLDLFQIRLKQWAPWLVLLVTAVAYLPALRAGFTNWDDKGYVTANEALISGDLWRLLTEPCAGNFHPLTMFTLWINYQLGPSAFSYHLLNVLLHLVCTLLVYRISFTLGGRRVMLALVSALLFGLHPVHVESVAWISERKDVLFACFFLLGMLSYSRYLLSGKAASLLVTLIFFILSLLSKPTAVTLPLVMLLLDFLGRRKVNLRMIAEKVPFFALAIAAGLLTLHFQAGAGRVADFVIRGPAERIALSGYGFLLYLSKTFVPVRLAAIHPMPPDNYALPWAMYLAPLLYPAWIAGAWLLRRKARLIAFAMLFYLCTMLPTLQFISFGEAVMAERYLYIPLLGFSLALGWLAEKWMQKKRIPVMVGACVLAVALGLGTFQRSKVWETSITLWNDTISKYPDNCFTALICRADLYREERRPGLAFIDTEEAIRQRPEHYFGYFGRGNAWYDLGEDEKAIQDYTKAIQLYNKDAKPYGNRAVVFFNHGQFELAIADFDMAIGLNPKHSTYYIRRSQAYNHLGNKRAALYDATKALELGMQVDPNYLKELQTP